MTATCLPLQATSRQERHAEAEDGSRHIGHPGETDPGVAFDRLIGALAPMVPAVRTLMAEIAGGLPECADGATLFLADEADPTVSDVGLTKILLVGRSAGEISGVDENAASAVGPLQLFWSTDPESDPGPTPAETVRALASGHRILRRLEALRGVESMLPHLVAALIELRHAAGTREIDIELRIAGEATPARPVVDPEKIGSCRHADGSEDRDLPGARFVRIRLDSLPTMLAERVTPSEEAALTKEPELTGELGLAGGHGIAAHRAALVAAAETLRPFCISGRPVTDTSLAPHAFFCFGKGILLDPAGDCRAPVDLEVWARGEEEARAKAMAMLASYRHRGDLNTMPSRTDRLP